MSLEISLLHLRIAERSEADNCGSSSSSTSILSSGSNGCAVSPIATLSVCIATSAVKMFLFKDCCDAAPITRVRWLLNNHGLISVLNIKETLHDVHNASSTPLRLTRNSASLEFASESFYAGPNKMAPLLSPNKHRCTLDLVNMLTKYKAHPSSSNQSLLQASLMSHKSQYKKSSITHTLLRRHTVWKHPSSRAMKQAPHPFEK